MLSAAIFVCALRVNICGNKFSWLNENDILGYFNFGGHDISWLQIVNKI